MLNSNYRAAYNQGVTDHPLRGETLSTVFLLVYEVRLQIVKEKYVSTMAH
jgi:hypothetical protein